MLIPEGPRAPSSWRQELLDLGWPPPSPLHIPPLATWPPNVPGPAIGFRAGNVEQNLFGAPPTNKIGLLG